mgnify:CR=1 FL=1
MERCTPGHLARLFGCDVRTIRKVIDEGLLPGKRDYRGWRIVPDERQAIEILQGLFLVEISGDIKKTDLKGGKKDEYL